MIYLENTREKAVLVTVDTGVEDCDALLDELEGYRRCGHGRKGHTKA